MNSCGKAKEDVGRTYAGVDGYCPLAAYLSARGFCLQFAPRPGVQHFACEVDFNLEWVIPLAQRLSASGPKAPRLATVAAGFGSASLTRIIEAYYQAGARQVDWQIK